VGEYLIKQGHKISDKPRYKTGALRLDGGGRRNCGGLPAKGAGFAFCVVFAGKADNTRREQGRKQTDYMIHGFGHGEPQCPGEAADGDRRKCGELRLGATTTPQSPFPAGENYQPMKAATEGINVRVADGAGKRSYKRIRNAPAPGGGGMVFARRSPPHKQKP
jgi:hypothetical protein